MSNVDKDQADTDEVGRYYSYFEFIDDLGGSDDPKWPEGKYDYAKKDEANLLSSECKDGLHRPVIDFDIPVKYVPSSTEGHGHLYIDRSCTWEQYKLLLNALYMCGFIQKGFHDFSIKRQASYVRPEWVKKPAPMPLSEAKQY
ncbi:MAG TPA: hypothetical protein VHD33_08265 [Legionellaceae bacterium]|nr:hypothetical protein [Legionellaceae bacterium]